MTAILAAGHVNWDVTLRVDRLPAPDDEARIHSQGQSGGGSAANVAVAAARLGVSTELIGSVGGDDHGHLARRALSAEGVDCGGLRTVEGETTVKFLLVDDDGEVAVLANEGVNEAVRPADVDEGRVRAADHVHLTSQRPGTAARIADVATAAGVPVSVDPGRRIGDRDYSRVLALADLVFLNDREAEAGLPEPVDGSDDRVVVVKRGSEGAVARVAGERVAHPGFDVEAVDTTGAGDAFAAGLLVARREGRSPDEALAFANACGALAATAPGARGAPDRAAVADLLGEAG